MSCVAVCSQEFIRGGMKKFLLDETYFCFGEHFWDESASCICSLDDSVRVRRGTSRRLTWEGKAWSGQVFLCKQFLWVNRSVSSLAHKIESLLREDTIQQSYCSRTKVQPTYMAGGQKY